MSAASTAAEPGASPGSSDRPLLLVFYSPRSGRCRRVDGYLAQVLQRRRNHDRFVIRRINCDERPDLVKRLRVDSVPTLIVAEDNVVQSRIEAPRGCDELVRFLSRWLR